MNKKIIWGLIAAIIVIGLIVVVVRRNRNQPELGNIKIGAVLPLSGTGAFVGEETKRGLEMCNPGNLEFIFEDSANLAATGVTAYNKIMQIDKPDIAIVSNSTIVPAILPIAKSNGDFVIAGVTTAANVGKEGGDTVFRYYLDGYKASQVIVESMIKPDTKKIGVLYVQNDFGETYKAGVQDYLKDKNISAYYESFQITDTDFSTSILKLRQEGIDSVMIVAYDMQTLQIITKIKELKLDADFYTAWMWNDSDFEKNPEILNDVYTARSTYLFGSNEKANEFNANYMNNYGMTASQFSAIGCDLSVLIGENEIRNPEQLSEIKIFNSINGEIIQGEYGDFDFPIQVIHYKDGSIN